MAISGGGLIFCNMAITNEDTNALSSFHDSKDFMLIVMTDVILIFNGLK